MAKILIPIILVFLDSALATVDTNKRGGHGIFHGLEEVNGKSSWLEESKVDNVKINQGNTNSLLSNTDTNSKNLKKSSLYLQPEPRGLEYLLDVPDHNPFLFRKREVRYDNVVSETRRRRQIYLQPGNVIPGSRGQAVLYGVPNGNGVPTLSNGNGYSSLPNGNGFPSLPNGQNPVVNNQGIPSGPYQNGGYPPQGTNGNGHIGGYKTYGY